MANSSPGTAGDFGSQGNPGNYSGGNFSTPNAVARLRSIVSDPQAPFDPVQIADDVAKWFALDAAVGAVGVATPEAAAAGGTLASGIASFFTAPIIVGAILVLLVLIFTEQVIERLGGAVPLINHTGFPQWLHNHFRWLDNFINTIAAFIVETAKHFVRDMANIIVIVLELNGIDLRSNYKVIKVSHTDPTVTKEFQYLQRQINQLKRQVQNGSFTVTGPTLPQTVSPQIWNNIHTIENDITTIKRTIIDMQSKLDHATNVANSVQSQMHDLSITVRSIRAVSLGLQDLEGQVVRLGNTVTYIQNNTSERLNNQSRRLEQLAPLGILLQPGLKGLKTLRQLEDTPCMCPKIGGIPNELGTALAVLEFVENG